jgi:rubrerythrin
MRNGTAATAAAVLAMAVAGAWTPMLQGQGLTVLPPSPPREIDKEQKKVVESWKAWTSIRIERNLLRQKSRDALQRIQRSEEGLEAYLDAKSGYYKTLIQAFAAERDALDGPGASANVDQRRSLDKARVEALLDQERKAREELDRLGARKDRDVSSRLAWEAQSQKVRELEKLRNVLDARLSLIDIAAGSQTRERETRLALQHTMDEIVRVLEEVAASIPNERASWNGYYAGLRELVHLSEPAAEPSAEKANAEKGGQWK